MEFSSIGRLRSFLRGARLGMHGVARPSWRSIVVFAEILGEARRSRGGRTRRRRAHSLPTADKTVASGTRRTDRLSRKEVETTGNAKRVEKREGCVTIARGGGGGYTTSVHGEVVYATGKKSQLSKHRRRTVDPRGGPSVRSGRGSSLLFDIGSSLGRRGPFNQSYSPKVVGEFRSS